MKNIEIYTTSLCGFCVRAKRLLDLKGVSYKELDVTLQGDQRNEMIERSGTHMVPQIFINGNHIGGSDDLAALEQSGELDRLLSID